MNENEKISKQNLAFAYLDAPRLHSEASRMVSSCSRLSSKTSMILVSKLSLVSALTDPLHYISIRQGTDMSA